jgi:hypothetical protein
VFEYTWGMVGITMDQVRAGDVADLAVSLLGRPDVEPLAADAECAEAMVAGAQRVISAMGARDGVSTTAGSQSEASGVPAPCCATWRHTALCCFTDESVRRSRRC